MPVLFSAYTSASTTGQEDPWPFFWRPGLSCDDTAPRCPQCPTLRPNSCPTAFTAQLFPQFSDQKALPWGANEEINPGQ